jgi:death-on-curing protein
MTASIWYPSVEDILAIHDDIVSEYPETSGGIRNRGDLEFIVEYIQRSYDDSADPIHPKAFDLLRLMVANHPFVDANKRTALNTTAVFYRLNGYHFEYDEEIRTILRRFGIDEASTDRQAVIEYLEQRTEAIDLDEELTRYRPDLLQYGVENLDTGSDDPND